jgi:hypothetical protein
MLPVAKLQASIKGVREKLSILLILRQLRLAKLVPGFSQALPSLTSWTKKWPTFRKEKHAMFGRRNIGQGTALWRPTVEWTRIVNRKLRKCLPHFASFCPRKNMKKRVWPREEVDWRRKLGYFESTAISQVRHVCNPSC